MSTVEECETLEQALQLSQGVLGQDDALYASALDKLRGLKEQRTLQQAAARTVEAAIGSGGTAELEAAIAQAAACGLVGDFIDGAKSLLFMLNQVAADAELAAAMEAASPEDTSALEAAIARAEKVFLDEYKLTHAAELLARMQQDRAERQGATTLLRDTIEAPVQTLAALEAALDAASGLKNKTDLPALLLELVDIAQRKVRTFTLALCLRNVVSLFSSIPKGLYIFLITRPPSHPPPTPGAQYQGRQGARAHSQRCQGRSPTQEPYPHPRQYGDGAGRRD